MENSNISQCKNIIFKKNPHIKINRPIIIIIIIIMIT
jgi:hypothetical protein